MSEVESLINQATSETNTCENWEKIIAVCELADSSQDKAKQAVYAISKKLYNKNLNVVLFALTLINSLIQNSTSFQLRQEIASRTLLDPLVKLVSSSHPIVKTRILTLIQQWATEDPIFSKDERLGYMVDTYRLLKDQDYPFPGDDSKPADYKPPSSSKQKEEEELQLAMALSLSAKDHVSVNTQKSRPQSPRPQHQQQQPLFTVKALYDFPSNDEGELSFRLGDVIQVYDDSTYKEWWKGMNKEKIGIFPCNYVEKIVTPVGSGSDGGEEILEKTVLVDKLLRLLGTIDPRMNLNDHNELQEVYHSVLRLRPSLIDQIAKHKQKQDELMLVNEKFVNATTGFRRLMEAAQQQQEVARQQAFPSSPSYYTPQQQGYSQQYQQPSQQYQQPPYTQGGGGFY